MEFIGFFLILLIQILPAFICAAIMRNKGRSSFGGFMLGLIVGVFGILIAALWPAHEPARRVSYARNETNFQNALPSQLKRTSCSHCGYKNDANAKFCQHCGTTITNFHILDHESTSIDRLKAEERFDSAETSYNASESNF